ncbi:hypothetical protein SDRG_11415, partial [Saprolegnia diclina VS20]
MKTTTFLTTSVAFAAATSATTICSAVPPFNYVSASTAHPQLAPALDVLKQQPIATWYTDQYVSDLSGLMAKCQDATPAIVVYGLPQKDCAHGYSSEGSNANTADYAKWIQKLMDQVGSNRDVVYILEPDALGLLANNPCATQHNYKANLRIAIEMLASNPKAKIYADVAAWGDMAKTTSILNELKEAGRLSGIAINTSNYVSNDKLLATCQSYSAATNGLHCIFDTSRNFNGSPSSEWCNAKSGGIGSPPTANTGYPLVDYFLWLKVPGESDGQCNDAGRTSDAAVGPSAGQFFPDGLERLWNQGHFVQKQGLPKIGGAWPQSTTASPTPVVTPAPTPAATNAPASPTSTPTTSTTTRMPTTDSSTTGSPVTETPTTETPVSTSNVPSVYRSTSGSVAHGSDVLDTPTPPTYDAKPTPSATSQTYTASTGARDTGTDSTTIALSTLVGVGAVAAVAMAAVAVRKRITQDKADLELERDVSGIVILSTDRAQTSIL